MGDVLRLHMLPILCYSNIKPQNWKWILRTPKDQAHPFELNNHPLLVYSLKQVSSCHGGMDLNMLTGEL